MQSRLGSRLQYSATGRHYQQGFCRGSWPQHPPTWTLEGCSPAVHTGMLWLGLPALPLRGRAPGPGGRPVQHSSTPARTTSSHSMTQGGPGEAEGAGLASVQEESGSACREHREMEGRCCQSISLPTGLMGLVLHSGRGRFLLPQSACGCTSVKGRSLMYDIAAARVNMEALTLWAGFLGQLWPVLGQLSRRCWHSAGWASLGPETEQQRSLSSVHGAFRHPQPNTLPWHRGVLSSPAQTGLLKHPHRTARTWR